MDPPQEGHQSQPQSEQQEEQQTTMNIESPVTDEETTKRIKAMYKTFKIYHYSFMIVIALLITNVCFNYYWNAERDRPDLTMASCYLLYYSFPVVIHLLLVTSIIRANTSDLSILIWSLRCLSRFQVVFYLIMTIIAFIAYRVSCLPFYGQPCDYSGKGLFFISLSLFSFICFINSCLILLISKEWWWIISITIITCFLMIIMAS